MGDLDVHGATAGHSLQILGTHDSTHTGSAAGIFDTGHHVGKGHQIFTGRSDDKAFHFFVVQFIMDGPLCVGNGFSPDARRIPDFNFTIVNINVAWLFRFAFYDQVVESGPGHFRCKKTTHVAASQKPGEGRFCHYMGSGGGGC